MDIYKDTIVKLLMCMAWIDRWHQSFFSATDGLLLIRNLANPTGVHWTIKPLARVAAARPSDKAMIK